MKDLSPFPRFTSGGTKVKTDGNQANSTVTLATIAGLTVPVEANTAYLIEYFIRYQAAATTTGIRVATAGPATPTRVLSTMLSQGSGAVAASIRHATAHAEQIVGIGVGTANTSTLAYVPILLENGANAGNVDLQFASEVDTSAVTVENGSMVRWSLAS